MLTQEQIQKLKPGDKLALSHPLIFREYDSENDELLARNNGEYIYFHAVDVELPSEHGTSLSRRSSVGAETEVPTPKHDPTRLFREGDKVRVVEWNGRHFHDRDHGTELTTGCICEVDDDEEATSEHGVLVVYEEQVRFIAPCFLELATPVEEIKPYRMELLQDGLPPDTYHFWAVMDKMGHEVARFWCEQYEEGKAKAAAETECARLNEEWRKEYEK